MASTTAASTAVASSTRPEKLINLIRGWPSPHILPAEQLKKAANAVLSDPTLFVPGLQYGPDPGYQPLREALSSWLGKAYGVPEIPDRICITGGASQNVACVLQSFTDPGYTRAVWAVAPCYFLACPIFDDSGFRGRLKAVPEDEEGIDLAWLEKGLESYEGPGGDSIIYKQPGPLRKIYKHVIYIVPTCANPSGKTMSYKRREALVQLARTYDALIICDDVYDFLQWDVDTSASASPSPDASLATTPVPNISPLIHRLSDIDTPLGPSPHDPPGKHFGHAISNGSFSKLVSPGVRTGWVSGTADFAHGLAQTGSTKSGGAPTQMLAAIVCEMLRSGDLDRHLLHAARPTLRARHAAILAAVEKYLRPLGVSVKATSECGEEARQVYGGYFVWLTLPVAEGLDAVEITGRAQEEENLIVAPGKIFEVLGDDEAVRFPRNIRLCYSWEDVENVVEGVERLGRVMKRILDGVERKSGGGVPGDLSGQFK